MEMEALEVLFENDLIASIVIMIFSSLFLIPYLKNGLPDYFRKGKQGYGLSKMDDYAIILGAVGLFIIGALLLVKAIYNLM